MNFDPNVTPLKTIPKENIAEFMKWFIADISQKLNKTHQIQTVDGITVVVVNTDSHKDGEYVLSKISMSSFHYLNEFIKQTFDSDPKEYYRNMILFQSEVNENRLILKF